MNGRCLPLIVGTIMVLVSSLQITCGDPSQADRSSRNLPPSVLSDIAVINGHVDGLSEQEDWYYVVGWACLVGHDRPVDVHLYAGGAAGSGQFVTSATADLHSEPLPCDSDVGHRFAIPISLSRGAELAGQPLFVHAIDFRGGRVNPLLSGSTTIEVVGTTAIRGYVDGVIRENGQFTITGWACIPGIDQAINVHAYIGASAYDGGQFLDARTADLASEPLPCSGSAGHRFKIPIPASRERELTGIPLFVHAIDFRGSGNGPHPVLPGAAEISDNWAGTEPIRGHVDGVLRQNDQLYIKGWACITGLSEALTVHAYVGGAAGVGGSFLASSTADLPSEQLPCESSIGHRFKIPIPSSRQEELAGQPLFVHAIDIRPGFINPLLTGSSHVPAPIGWWVDSSMLSAMEGDLRENIQNLFDEAVAYSEQSGGVPVELIFSAADYYLDCSEFESELDSNCNKITSARPCLTISGSNRQGQIIVSGADPSRKTRFLSNSAQAGFLRAQNLESISIQNVEFTQQVKPFTQARVVSVDGGWITVDTQSGYPAISNDLCNCINLDRQNLNGARDWGFVVDPSNNNLPRQNQEQKAGTYHSFSGCIRDSTVRTRLHAGADAHFFRANDILIQLMAKGGGTPAFFLHNNGHVWVNNSAVRSASSAAFILTYNDKSILLTRNQVLPEAGALLTTNGDSFHLQHNRAPMVFAYNTVGRMADDGINTYTIPSEMETVLADNRIRVRHHLDFRVGDLVQVYSPWDGQIRGHAYLTNFSYPTNGIAELTLSTHIPGMSAGTDSRPADWLANVSAATPHSLFHGNTFSWHRGRDILLRGAHCRIEHNNFSQINWSGVVITSESVHHREGPVPYEVSISNNTFQGGDFSWISPLIVTAETSSGNLASPPWSIDIFNNHFCGFLSPSPVSHPSSGTTAWSNSVSVNCP